jgi:hypothetical protein
MRLTVGHIPLPTLSTFRSCFGRMGFAIMGLSALARARIQLALAMNMYGSKFFAGGGVPPLALEGPLPQGAEAMKRAMADIHRAIDTAKSQDKPIFPMPPGYKLTPVGFDPEKGQMTEARRFQVEEIARVLQIPPVFLQDLTHGTFSNTEQQDLHLVKHLINQWAQALEEELNLKLFGQRNGGRYCEHNLDGLMRGDFVTRMNGLSQAVQTAILTPNEARALENRPAMPNGDELLIQGATVPLECCAGGTDSLTNEYNRRRSEKPAHRINNAVRCRIWASLNGAKKDRTFALLGYSLSELVRHLERQFANGMNWDNYGEWHVDHILPLSSFEYKTHDCPEFRAAWALTNLRPMWATDNLKKGAKRFTLL